MQSLWRVGEGRGGGVARYLAPRSPLYYRPIIRLSRDVPPDELGIYIRTACMMVMMLCV